MSTSAPGLYEFGPFRMDVQRRVFTRGGHLIPLAPKTFDLLVLLVQSDGHAVSKQALMTALWPDTIVEEANLSFQISTLRKALGESGSRWIETLPKHRYRFVATVRDGQAEARSAASAFTPPSKGGVRNCPAVRVGRRDRCRALPFSRPISFRQARDLSFRKPAGLDPNVI